MTNVIGCHMGDIKILIFVAVYTLSKCSGGELNFDRGEKLNPKTLEVPKFTGETRYSITVVGHISHKYKLDFISYITF